MHYGNLKRICLQNNSQADSIITCRGTPQQEDLMLIHQERRKGIFLILQKLTMQAIIALNIKIKLYKESVMLNLYVVCLNVKLTFYVVNANIKYYNANMNKPSN
jgi:hypothetical protein